MSEKDPPEVAREATEEGMGTIEVNNLPSQVFDKPAPITPKTPKQMTMSEDTNSIRGTITTAPAPIPPMRNRRRRVTELRCGEVRWFFRRKDLGSKWIPFKGLDSLRLEMRWRKDIGMDIDAQMESHVAEIGDDVVVLDGLYRMSENHTKITAVYWKEDEAELRRGSWFLPDGQPIQASMADSIEAHHLQYFRGQTIPEGTSMFSDKEASRKPQLTELQLPDNIEVKWSSVIDVFLYSTTKASRLLRYVTWGKDTKLRRGYEKEAEWEDGSPEVSHLILVVHGIGQKGYENLIAKNTEEVRDQVNLVMERHYPDEKSRPMLLPVEWRSGLQLDDGQTDVITLPKMSSVRQTLNSTAMDIMYYQSPLYRQEIVGGVVKSINQVYSLFKKHNPQYNGPVSIFAHSLGSVISYDIISHWSPLLMYDEYVANAIKAQLEEQSKQDDNSEAANSMRILQEVREKLQKDMSGGIQCVLQAREEKLQFPVSNLFCVGSPLGVFLVMRGAQPETIIPPTHTLNRIFNIFHPYDPVAYRLEPLYAAELKDIRPVKLFAFTDQRSKKNYDELAPDVYKNYLKKKKAAERKGNKSGDKKNKEKEVVPAEDELDEEDEVDSDDSASIVRSACSSPRSLSPTREEAGRNTEKNGSGGKSGGGSGWWFNKSSNSNTSTNKKDAEIEKAKEVEVKKTSKSKKKKKIETVSLKDSPRKSKSKRLTNVKVSRSKVNLHMRRASSNLSRITRRSKKVKIELQPEKKMTEAEKIIESIPEEYRLQKRIDFSVQPGLTDKSYWSVLKSHFSYWTNPDLAMFLVNIIYTQRDEAAKDLEAQNATDKALNGTAELNTAIEELPRELNGGGDNTTTTKTITPSTDTSTVVIPSNGTTVPSTTVVQSSSIEPQLTSSSKSSISIQDESPLSVMNLPREEHLLPDAPGRLPTTNRQPPPIIQRSGI